MFHEAYPGVIVKSSCVCLFQRCLSAVSAHHEKRASGANETAMSNFGNMLDNSTRTE